MFILQCVFYQEAIFRSSVAAGGLVCARAALYRRHVPAPGPPLGVGNPRE